MLEETIDICSILILFLYKVLLCFLRKILYQVYVLSYTYSINDILRIAKRLMYVFSI